MFVCFIAVICIFNILPGCNYYSNIVCTGYQLCFSLFWVTDSNQFMIILPVGALRYICVSCENIITFVELELFVKLFLLAPVTSTEFIEDDPWLPGDCGCCCLTWIKMICVLIKYLSVTWCFMCFHLMTVADGLADLAHKWP